MSAITIQSPFWKRYRDSVAHDVVPYQWEVINDERAVELPFESAGNEVGESEGMSRQWSHAVRNLRVAAGEEQAVFNGMVFQDSDVYKWLEEAAYVLAYEPNVQLQTLCDGLVELIARAQAEDGYLDTPYQIKTGEYENRERFGQLQQSHEMYVMGHYIEAAVAYWQVTRNEKALDVARRMADCLDQYFGDEPGKIPGADGHPEIELALARLFEATQEQRYLNLAKYFIDVRGKDPQFYVKQNTQLHANGATSIFPGMDNWSSEYTLSARPIQQQQTAEGHAVRVVYLIAGIMHVARLSGDEELAQTAQRLWDNIVQTRMYITGGIGSTHIGEAFTYDYDLPNGTAYAESCASVGMCFVAREMLEHEIRGEYADVLEKELFNGAISGIALDGKHFFYVNALEVDPDASERNPDRHHVLSERAEWFGCACCPANIARLIASVDQYLYTVRESERVIAAHQFIANDAELLDGVHVRQESDFPNSGEIRFAIDVPEGSRPVTFMIRIPSWCYGSYSLLVNGVDMKDAVQPVDGFVAIPVQQTAVITLSLDMSVRLMRAHTSVRHDAGKIAVMRGPVVYCAEGTDNYEPLWNYRIDRNLEEDIQVEGGAGILDGLKVLRVPAVRRVDDDAQAPLYALANERFNAVEQHTRLTMIPYQAWANRGKNAMQVWFDEMH